MRRYRMPEDHPPENQPPENQPEPICVVCQEPIRGAQDRSTIQGKTYHSRCFERLASKRKADRSP